MMPLRLRPKFVSLPVRKIMRRAGQHKVNLTVRKMLSKAERSLKPMTKTSENDNIFTSNATQLLIDHVARKIGKPIVVNPGATTHVLNTPEVVYITIRPPFRTEELLHELGHIVSGTYTGKSLPIGLPFLVMLPFIGLAEKKTRQFFYPAAALTDLLLTLPAAIKEYEAQRQAVALGATESPFLQFLSRTLPGAIYRTLF